MGHYICTGGCKGESETPGVCQAKDCKKFGEPLEECDCTDGKHFGAFEDKEKDEEEYEPMRDKRENR
jgi:hypothetical protein